MKGPFFSAQTSDPYRSTLASPRADRAPSPPPRHHSTTRTHESCWRPVAVQLAGLGHLSHAGAATLDDTSVITRAGEQIAFRGHSNVLALCASHDDISSE